MENLKFNPDGTVCMNEEIAARLAKIKDEAKKATEELVQLAALKKGDIFVVGCSTSEVTGRLIGHASVPEVARAVFEGIYPVLKDKGIYLAAQCCEHINRAIIVERECADLYRLDEVCVRPVPKAGGSFATAAYEAFECPAALENIRAHAGMDIGGTLIGMHLRAVAVPVRLSVDKIGDAPIICAKTRPKLIGGERARY